jgi:hypothetical protein
MLMGSTASKIIWLDLRGVARAIRLSRQIMGTIKRGSNGSRLSLLGRHWCPLAKPAAKPTPGRAIKNPRSGFAGC